MWVHSFQASMVGEGINDILRFRARIIRPTTIRPTRSTTIIRTPIDYSPSLFIELTFSWRCVGYHSDGSVFYRYPDGSEYYRRKNGRVEFRLLQDPPEKVEGAGPAATPPKAEERTLSCWYPWPPPLNLSVRTDGPSLTIRDASGSTITFEPVGPGVNAEQTLVGDGSVSPLSPLPSPHDVCRRDED